MLVGVGLLAVPASAVVVPRQDSPLQQRVVVDQRLDLSPRLVPADAAAATAAPAVGAGLKDLRARHGAWTAYVDERSGHVQAAEGAGIPWIPGRGNRLKLADLAAERVDLALLERTAREALAEWAPLLGADERELVLDRGRSGQVADYLWFVDFDVVREGLAIEGARVVFRVNNGNLIQVGAENLPPPGVRVPADRVGAEGALDVLESHVGGFDAARDRFSDVGSLHLLPVRAERGQGYGLAKVWQFVFRRAGEMGTWRARVDATTAALLEFKDVNEYGTATGGTYRTDRPAVEEVMPLPFADVGGGTFTDSAGLFPGSAGTTTLAGSFVRVVDTCGAISQAANSSGAILLGTSGGTDCTTPGNGGAGNTHATRTQFYMVNRAKEVARGWLPANTWLQNQLTVNVNLNQVCNAYWNGSSLNFFRSGGGCENTGELPGVSLHEYGHGLDSNDGNGSSPENGTGETYGDFTAALAIHSSCIGNGFDQAFLCSGYGDACTSCSGVRDIDWAKHVDNTPHTVGNFTQTNCPPRPGYVGPCNREGHCESLVPSEGLWDFANRDLPLPGSGSAWATTDRLWYLSRSTATSAFVCNTGVNPWTSHGCAAGTLWRTMRAVDDDDGNLANGTPHSCNLYAAFNRHGIACASDVGANVCFAGCAPPAVPTLSVVHGTDQVTLSWTDSGVGTRYDVYRNETGCNAGFVKIANDVAALSHVDNDVADGYVYYYQVVAQPTGNEACAAAPTSCMAVEPGCVGAPSALAATAGVNSVALSWTAGTGTITSYQVLRSLTPGGPYTQIGTTAATSFTDNAASGGTTYYYRVRSVAACGIAQSGEISATASGPCAQAPSFAGLASVAPAYTASCSLQLSWLAATGNCGSPVTYNVYRSASSGFVPSAANRIAQGVTGTSYSDVSGLTNGTPAYYVVRAVDAANGLEDANGVEKSAAPAGVLSTQTFYSRNFDGAGELGTLAGWSVGTFLGGGPTADWRGVQDCLTPPSSPNFFRFGGTNCNGGSTNYGDDTYAYAQPNGAGGVAIPAGTVNTRLEFDHRREFQIGPFAYDGGTLRISLDGTNYFQAQFHTVGGAQYNGSIAGSCLPAGTSGRPAFIGTQTSFVHTTVDLDWTCNFISGGSGGCAGSSVRAAFIGIADCNGTADGWFLDNVVVRGEVPTACSATPHPLQFLTATAKTNSSPGNYNQLQWQTPASGPCTSIILRYRTDGVFPTGPTNGSAVPGSPVACGGNNVKGGISHSNLSVGETASYSAFVESGGQTSERRTVRATTQTAANTPPSMWTYYTGAASLSPPGIGSIFALSNDRTLHAVNPGDGWSTTSGLWPTGWKPFAMNGPAQHRPVVVNPGVGGAKTVFVGSQDGRAYAVNGTTGAQIWASPQLGAMVQAAPAAVLTAFGGSKDLVFVGTRDATADNKFYALNLADGTVAANWPFDNGGGANGIGIINSMADVDYAASRVYFTSRARPGGSNATAWCLSFAGAAPALCAGNWPRAIGDVDGSAIRVGNRLYVGTNAGTVRALDATTGDDVWTFTPDTPDGPVKGFVFPRFGTSPLQLVFSTNIRIWNIVDNGASAALAPGWPAGGIGFGTIPGPSIPLAVPFSNFIYVGSTGSGLYEIDATNPTAPPKHAILPNFSATGAPSLDTSTGLVHVGALSGALNAVAVPLP